MTRKSGVLAGALVAAAAWHLTASPHARPFAAACDAGPSNVATAPTTDLEEHAADWGIFCEGVPTADKRNVSAPALDGSALQLSLSGGAPYSNAHFYRTLAAEPDARRFIFSLSFRFSATTFNNEEQPSVVQAIEFGMNKWHDGMRYEFALQWRNVGDRSAPEWRYWDPHRASAERWVALDIPDRLAADQWHTLTLEGEIVDGQTRYRRFNIDQRCHALERTLAPARAAGEPNRLAATVQLDGNAVQASYDVFVDQITFVRSATDDVVPCGVVGGRPIDAMESSSNWRAGTGSGALVARASGADGCRRQAVRLDYDLGPGRGAWVQIRRDFNPPVDLSASDHIRLLYRGTARNMLEIGLIGDDGRIYFATPWRNATHVPGCTTATWDLQDFRSDGRTFPNLRRVAAIFISVSNNDGGAGGAGSLIVDEIEGVSLRPLTLPTCDEHATDSSAAALRAARWIAVQQTAGGLVKSWQEEPDDFAWLYDQALALLVLLETDPERAAMLARTLLGLQRADGSWFAGYRYLTAAPITEEQPTGAIAWTVYALARYALAAGDAGATEGARAGARWLARLQRSNGSMPALAGAAGASAPTEPNLGAWWAFAATGQEQEAARLRDFITSSLWDAHAGRFKADAASRQIFLDNQTWGAAFMRAVGRPTDARRALSYARRTLEVATVAPRAGAVCGFDGAGPFGMWNEGTLQYVAERGEHSQTYWDHVVRQQAADGGVPGSAMPAVLSAYIVWLTPWHGVSAAAWTAWAPAGGPPGWRPAPAPEALRR